MTPTLFAFAMPGTTELLIIAGVALLLFGSRLPSVCRNIGRSAYELKKGLNEAIDECSDETS